MFGLSKTVARIAIAAIAIILVLGFLQVRSCQQERQRAAEARLQQGQMGAQGESAKDAIATQGKAGERERQSEELTRTNEREIRNAQGASDPVNPAARDAGLRSLCRRAAYIDSERCRVFRPDPAGVAERR